MLLQRSMKPSLRALTVVFLNCSIGDSRCALLTGTELESSSKLEPSRKLDPSNKLDPSTKGDFRCFDALCLFKLALVENFFPQLHGKRIVAKCRLT